MAVKTRHVTSVSLGAVFVVFFLSSQGVFAEVEKKHTVRNTYWGMTPDEVKKVEKWEARGGKGDYLSFKGELKEGVETGLQYDFHNNLLVSLSYEMRGCKDLYQFFYQALVKKYGRPHKSRTELDVYKDQMRFQRLGIYDVNPDIIYSDWIIHDKSTNLRLVCHYSGFVYILYEDKAYAKQKEQLKKDKERDASYNVQNDL